MPTVIPCMVSVTGENCNNLSNEQADDHPLNFVKLTSSAKAQFTVSLFRSLS